MSGATFLDLSLVATFLMLSVAFVLVIARIVIGPTLPDRILALDLLVVIAVGFICAFGIRSGFAIYLDIAIALGLVGLLSTIALARFVLARGDVSMSKDAPDAPDEGAGKLQGGRTDG